MSEFFVSSAYFGVVLSIGAFLVGRALQKRFKHPLCNPLLIAIVLVILFLQADPRLCLSLACRW